MEHHEIELDLCLDDIEKSLGRLKTQSEDINKTLDNHNILIDELDQDIEQSDGQLKLSIKKIGAILEKPNVKWWCIGALAVIAIVLLIAVIFG